MPPGIFKMINGSKYMRYHQTVPQAHLDGRVHDIPQAHVLGGGSSVNAQVYMRGRPSGCTSIASNDPSAPTPARQIFSLAPSNVVHAPGRGLPARTVRTSVLMNHGRFRPFRASSW